jgi:hypothetical protein
MACIPLTRPLLAAAVIAALSIVAFTTSVDRADAQPYPQSPAGASRLQGKHVTVYLQNTAASSSSRSREAVGTDPVVRINDVPVSVAGTVSGFSTDGGGRWIILSRRDAGEVWVPLDNVQLIEVTADKR